MAWNDFLFGTQQQVNQAPLYSTQTQQTLNDLLKQGQSQLNANPTSFAPIAQEARSNFASKTVPMLAERYGSFSGSSRPSSGEIGLVSGAGADLDRGLAALSSDYNLRQQVLAQNLIKLGITPSFQNIITPPQPGAAHALAPAAGQALAPLVGQVASGFPFATAGAGVGSAIGGPLGGAIGAGVGGFGDFLSWLYSKWSSSNKSGSNVTNPTINTSQPGQSPLGTPIKNIEDVIRGGGSR